MLLPPKVFIFSSGKTNSLGLETLIQSGTDQIQSVACLLLGCCFQSPIQRPGILIRAFPPCQPLNSNFCTLSPVKLLKSFSTFQLFICNIKWWIPQVKNGVKYQAQILCFSTLRVLDPWLLALSEFDKAFKQILKNVFPGCSQWKIWLTEITLPLLEAVLLQLLYLNI